MPAPRTITAGLLVIGDEILSGRTRDVNIAATATFCTDLGIELREVRVVADDTDDIVAALDALRHRYTYVFTTGGIGPTHDDITADAVARAFGVALPVNAEARAMLEARWKATGTEINEARLRMARIPEGARLIVNSVSAAPGFRIGNVHVMAGVPVIMQAMLEAIRGFVDWALGMGGSSLNFVTRTPAEGTYDSPTVRSLHDFSRAIVNVALAVVVMWGGFNVIIKEHTRSPYHEAMELLPRVILAALAANLTIEFARMLIDINNALAAGVGDVGLPGYDQATPQQEGLALIFTAVAYGIVAILLVFQMLMRLALLAMLIVLGPIAALLWVLPQTQQWTRWWTDLFVITVFQQTVQVMVLALGTALMVELTPGSLSNALLTMLLGLRFAG